MTRYTKLLIIRSAEIKFPFLRRMQSGKLRLILSTLLSVFCLHAIVSKRRLIIPYAELVVTEKCSLRCVDCANLMQYYNSPQSYDKSELLHELEEMGENGAELYVLQVLGGEPLLHKNIAEILTAACQMGFIHKIQVVTNATILPNEGLTAALNNRKITILISDYGKNSTKMNELIALLQREKISYEKAPFTNWEDYGDLSQKNLSERELVRSYKECPSAECKSIIHGKLFTCPRSAHMYNLGLLSNPEQYISLTDATSSREKLSSFYNRKYDEACRFCNPPWARPVIEAGLQKRDLPDTTEEKLGE